MIPATPESKKIFECNQSPEQLFADDYLAAMLFVGDPWLESDEGKGQLDALIQRAPDRVFGIAMDGRPGDWRSTALKCLERGLAADTVDSTLSLKLRIGSSIDDGTEKCRFLLEHMEQGRIADMLADIVRTNDVPGLKMIAAASRELLMNATVDLGELGSGSLLQLAFTTMRSDIYFLLLEILPELASRPTGSGENLLQWAISCGLPAMIPLLLAAAPSLEYMNDGEGRTPLHLAFTTLDIDSIRTLLDHAKEPQRLVEKTDKSGWTVLHYLAGTPEDKKLLPLLDILRPYPRLLPMCGDLGETALHVASVHGNRHVAVFLLQRAPYLARKGMKYGSTPLDSAIEAGYTEMVALLAPSLAKSVDESGCTVLLAALKSSAFFRMDEERKRIASMLFDCVTHSSTAGYRRAWEIMEEAARSGGSGVLITLLLEFAPELAQWRSPRGMTALHIAAESGNLDGVKQLIGSKHGKEMVHVQIKGGLRPIDLALRHGHVFVVDALLSAHKHLSDQFGSVAEIFDTTADRWAWRNLAMVIADNDYAQFLSRGVAEKKFMEFTKKLNPLTDREIGQRLALLAIWSDAAGEDDDRPQGFGDGLAACHWLSELFSDKWLTRGERWKNIRQEALVAIERIEQQSPEPKLPVSRLARDIRVRLLPPLTTADDSQMRNVDGPGMVDMSAMVDEEPPTWRLNPESKPYFPVGHRLHWTNLELIPYARQFGLNPGAYGRYLLEITQVDGKPSPMQAFDREK